MDGFKVYEGIKIIDFEEKCDELFHFLVTKGYIDEKTDKNLFVKIFSSNKILKPPKIKWLKSSGEFQMFFQFLNHYNLISLFSRDDTVSAKVHNGRFFVKEDGKRFPPLCNRSLSFLNKLNDLYFSNEIENSPYRDMDSIIKKMRQKI